LRGLALRGLAARKLRGALTAFAILLGVAMVAGTLMLKGSVETAFDDIFSEAAAGVDVSVTPRLAVDGGFDAPSSSTALPERLVAEVKGVEGVEQAVGQIDDYSAIAILDEDGQRIGPPQGGPPHIAESVTPEPFTPWTWVEGAQPSGPGEVGIDSITAEEEGYAVGERVRISGADGAKEYEVAGIGRFGSGVPLGGASIAVFDPAEAQAITAKEDEFDVILVEAADGLAPEELVGRLDAALPGDVQVRTGAEEAAQQSADLKEGFGFLTTALLIFAGISLFVGAFLIFNTFSITVAQRTREFGMLRTLGASSRQVLGTVAVEALALGLLASLLGIAAGIGFVELVVALFDAIGFELPQSGLVIGPATILIPLLVGIVATLGSAIVPAVRATRVTPLEALRDTSGGEDALSPRRRIGAAAAIAAALVLLGLGLFGAGSFSAALPLLGGGLVLLFVGIAALAGALVRPLAAFVGGPIERLRGVTGRLARENTLRNPNRTATTSAALMVGVALVVFASVFSTSATKSVGDALDRTFIGDLTVYNVDGFSPIAAGVGRELAEVEGVETVSPVTGSAALVEGVDGSSIVNGIDPATIAAVGRLDWQEGDDSLLPELEQGGALVESRFGEENGIEVGDTLQIVAPDGGEVEAEVIGSVRDRVNLLLSSVALPVDVLRERFDARQDFALLVGYAEGADPAATRAEIDALLERRFPQAEARSQQQLKDEQREAINQVLALIYVLLALSVVISLFGVINTLVLTVYERTREIGMLRAIGAARGQIRRMIRYESLITAMIGAIIGVVIGIAVGVAAVEALAEDGFVLGIPVGGIVFVLVIAALAGVLAGVWPARRASRVEVMEALQYE
jgi:putative ABC transport system permease protein